MKKCGVALLLHAIHYLACFALGNLVYQPRFYVVLQDVVVAFSPYVFEDQRVTLVAMLYPEPDELSRSMPHVYGEHRVGAEHLR